MRDYVLEAEMALEGAGSAWVQGGSYLVHQNLQRLLVPSVHSSVWSLRPLDAGLAFTIHYIARDERIASPAVDGAFRSPSEFSGVMAGLLLGRLPSSACRCLD